ncbi:MAG: acetylesterase [Clostridia bacterium]|nr:acetylesterase [Clostridia bacterium]
MALMNVSFFSPTLRRTVPLTVVIPTDKQLPGQPGYQQAAPYKTLYLLHGAFGSCLDWLSGTRMRPLAQNANLCVVMPSGENKFYADSKTSGDRYGTFVSEDLVNFIESTFPVSKKREDRFIAGLSMGGYGAVVNGLRHPETFGAIGAMSSAFLKKRILNSVDEPGRDLFTRTEYMTMFGLDDVKDFEGSEHDYDMLARKAARRKKKPDIYLCCGTEDSLLPVNHQFRELLSELGYNMTYEEWEGDHNWKFWDEAIEKLINWLPLGEAVKGVSSENVQQKK